MTIPGRRRSARRSCRAVSSCRAWCRGAGRSERQSADMIGRPRGLGIRSCATAAAGQTAPVDTPPSPAPAQKEHRGVRCRHHLPGIDACNEIDRSEAPAAAHHRRARKPTQARVDRQRSQPRLVASQHALPVHTDLAQLVELMCVEADDRRRRPDVARRLGASTIVAVAACPVIPISDSDVTTCRARRGCSAPRGSSGG